MSLRCYLLPAVRRPLGLGGAVYALFLAISLPALANNLASQSVLQLTDGRVFQAWSVLRETDDSLTIKYANGAAKIMKNLLPSDVRAQFPVVEQSPPAPPPLPPEPRGLEKPMKGERSITAQDVISGIEVRWTCRVAVKGKAGGITRSSKNRADEFKTDYVFPFEVDDVGSLEDALAKARKWAVTVVEKKPPSFDKSMGQVIAHEWTFSWDNDRVIVHTGMSEAPTFQEQDLEKIQVLLAALPHMEKERLDETKAAEAFAATLK